MVTHATYKNEKGQWVEPKDIEKDGNELIDNNNLKVETGKIEK